MTVYLGRARFVGRSLGRDGSGLGLEFEIKVLHELGSFRERVGIDREEVGRVVSHGDLNKNMACVYY